ncbi:hypothetical protein N0K08_11865 [Acidovorax sp. Be4]|uniref:Uncharacterized protein n=1 Tax=Acidovorax bellezanensis TaxID=2976702 RepID=A0ABT2PN94_9BURK|nr:hypothetical protein [Acidovorax sp. Be4]MCT9811336.1 hypothetical protein [Acidovorax sp. Be4]
MKFTATPSRWAEILKNDEAIQTSLGVLEKQPEEQVGEVLIQRWDQGTMANHGASKTPYRGMYASVDQLEEMNAATLIGAHCADDTCLA